MARDEDVAEDGNGELIGRAIVHGLLRPALELAVVVARAGADARPPLPPPGPLRPLLRHAKWTARAMSSVARVIGTDDEFRLQVAQAAEHLDTVTLGAPSRLWLVRPDGWQEDLADAVRVAEEAAERRRSDKEERLALRQVATLTEELGQRQAEVELALERAADAEAEVADVRRERRDALDAVEHLTEELLAAQTEAQAWRNAAEEGRCAAETQGRSLGRAMEELAQVRRERESLAAEVARLEAELDEARTEHEADGTAAAQMRSTVARAVGEAASAAVALGEALGSAARSLEERSLEEGSLEEGSLKERGVRSTRLPSRSDNGESDRAGGGPVEGRSLLGLVDGVVEDMTGRGGVTSKLARRRPLRLPPAVFEDSPEAAVHLVRSGVLLLVDGYNVSLFAWPELALSAQRHRMTTSLAELAARSGAAVRVVFDGDAQVAYPEVRGAPRTPIRVVFSTPGIDADEVIIALVDEHPVERAVVVATNDRRVQEEVRRRGANVLTTPQLLGLLRRAGPR